MFPKEVAAEEQVIEEEKTDRQSLLAPAAEDSFDEEAKETEVTADFDNEMSNSAKQQQSPQMGDSFGGPLSKL